MYNLFIDNSLANKLPPAESTPSIKFPLDSKNETITFNQFKQLNCFDETYIIGLIELLDLFNNGEDTVKCHFTKLLLKNK